MIRELNAKECIQENGKGKKLFSDQETWEAADTWNNLVDLGIKSKSSNLENKLWNSDSWKIISFFSGRKHPCHEIPCLQGLRVVDESFQNYHYRYRVPYIRTILCMCCDYLTLCDPMDPSRTGSSVHGIFQARIPEQVVISYSRVSSWPRDGNCVFCVACIGRWSLYHCATGEVILCMWLPYYVMLCYEAFSYGDRRVYVELTFN